MASATTRAGSLALFVLLSLAVMTWPRLILTLIGQSILHPTLAVDLLRVAWRFRSRRWFRRFPFLPLPARDYVRWRMVTAYGDPAAIPPAEDVIRYARWVGEEG